MRRLLQCIRLGQRFGLCLAKVEAAQLRLTRWGEPIGLLENKISLAGGAYKDAEVIKAYEWLRQNEISFEEARQVSEKYAEKQRKKGKNEDLVLMGEEDGYRFQGLVRDMTIIAIERQKKLSLKRKLTWALHGKEAFENLVDDLVTLINNLVELFPSNKPRLEELCNQEVQELEKDNVLDLVEVLKNDDKRLKNTDDEILSKALDEQITAHRLDFQNLEVGGTGVNRFGDEYVFQSGVKPGNMKVDGMEIKSSGFTHTGHVFYGKQGTEGMHSYGSNNLPLKSESESDSDWDKMHGI